MFVLTSFVRALRFIAAYAIANIQSAMEYRISFWVKVFTMVANDSLWLFFWWTYFQQFPVVHGWLHLLCPAAVAAPVHLASAGRNGWLHGAHRIGRNRHFPARSAKVREWESARNAGMIHSPAPTGAGEHKEKLQILLKPAQQAILVVTYMLAFVQPMPFTRVHH